MTLPPSPAPPPGAPPPGADGSDPSMEEILASIRRILNEDETSAPEAPVEAPPEEAPPEDDGVLVLDRSMLVAVPEPPPEQHVAAEAVSEAHIAPIEPPDELLPAEAEFAHLINEPAVAHQPELSEMEFDPPPVAPPTRAPDPSPHPPAATPYFTDTLVAPETAAATASSVDDLLRTLAASRATQVYRGGPTIEDLVREEMRPLLKQWLDDHLPPLVERLVRAEIERVVGRAVP